MQVDKSPSARLVVFCERPPFDTEDLRDKEFVFVVCAGRSEFLSCQLLPCDVIVMTVGHPNCDARSWSCSGLHLPVQPKLPLLIVMADDPTMVPEHLHPHAIIPERASRSELMAVLRNLPWTR